MNSYELLQSSPPKIKLFCAGMGQRWMIFESIDASSQAAGVLDHISFFGTSPRLLNHRPFPTLHLSLRGVLLPPQLWAVACLVSLCYPRPHPLSSPLKSGCPSAANMSLDVSNTTSASNLDPACPPPCHTGHPTRKVIVGRRRLDWISSSGAGNTVVLAYVSDSPQLHLGAQVTTNR